MGAVDFLLTGTAAVLVLAAVGGWWTWRRHHALAAELAQRNANLAALAAERERLFARTGELEREIATRESRIAERRAEAEAWRALLEAAPFPVWRRDQELTLDWVNATYARMVEATPARVIDDSIELAAPLAPEQPRRLAEQARDDGGTAVETRRFVVAGDRRTYRITETAMPDGELAGYGQDITDLEDLRHELRRRDSAHAEVLQSLGTAISIYGPDKRLIFHNRAFSSLWQMDEAFLMGDPPYSEVLERLREERKLPEVIGWQGWKRAQMDLFTSAIEPREEVLHLPDGRTVRSTVTPHPFGGLLFAHQDVTDQLKLERSRNTLVAVQRATLDNLYEAVAVFGGDGSLRLYNRAFAHMWALEDELLATQPHIERIVDAMRPLLDASNDWDARRETMLLFGTERTPQRTRLERHDGAVIDGASMPLPDGAILLTFLDVSDGVKIERALRERNEALQTADQMKSEFLANVSYELRTPLNSIIGFAEILNNQYFGTLNDKQKEYGRGIIDSSHQLLILINDILDLASIEAGQMKLEHDRFDLHAALLNLVALVRERARRTGLTIEFDCPADIGEIEGDESRVKQVLFNLVSNALKFTPPRGTVALGARRGEGFVELFVRDTGVGIPDHEQAAVFEKFTKSRAALVSGQRGAGLGLSLVRSFIELHGGTVELRSRPDQGTEVICRLPQHLVGERDLSVVQA
jgi:signal transduction histidine kinase